MHPWNVLSSQYRVRGHIFRNPRHSYSLSLSVKGLDVRPQFGKVNFVGFGYIYVTQRQFENSAYKGGCDLKLLRSKTLSVFPNILLETNNLTNILN